MFITNGGFADIYVVFAKVDGDKFSAFIVERQDRLPSRRGRTQDGYQRLEHDAAVFSPMRKRRLKTCSAKSARVTRSLSTF